VRRARAPLAALLIAAALAAGCGGGGAGTGPPDAPAPGLDPGRVALTFLAEIAGEPFACGRTFDGVGTGGATIEPGDLRFYVSEVRLVRDDGTEEALVLDQDGAWQVDDLALLDFEDATGRCSLAGSRETNRSVRGTVPPDACPSRATTATRRRHPRR